MLCLSDVIWFEEEAKYEWLMPSSNRLSTKDGKLVALRAFARTFLHSLGRRQYIGLRTPLPMPLQCFDSSLRCHLVLGSPFALNLLAFLAT